MTDLPALYYLANPTIRHIRYVEPHYELIYRNERAQLNGIRSNGDYIVTHQQTYRRGRISTHYRRPEKMEESLMRHHPTAAGKSSYDLIDTDLFWKALSVEPGMTVLDLACGAGRYTLPLAEKVGPSGRIIAVDLWAEGIEQLTSSAGAADLQQIETHIADAGNVLPIESATVDLCLLATVLHDFAADGIDRTALKEVARVLAPDGILAVVEFIKQDGPPGPPKAVRLSLQEVTMRLLPFGLIRFGGVVELGRHAYFCQFRRLQHTGLAK